MKILLGLLDGCKIICRIQGAMNVQCLTCPMFINNRPCNRRVVRTKDTNRKIRKTKFIDTCGFKNGSTNSAENTDEV